MKIKGFDKDLKCRGFQFEIGKEYKIEGKPLELCTDGVFHYGDSLQVVHNHYQANNVDNRFCEVQAIGVEVTDGDKYGCNHIRIVREIVGEELADLKGLTRGNTGLFNTGFRNTGGRNTGDMNTGDSNTGGRNTGDRNTGFRNTGCSNTGDRNTGDSNTGGRNTGDRNTGNSNTGNMNIGCSNTGDRNTGFRNTGNMNTGSFNSCNFSSGFFCTQEPNARIFNIDTEMTVSDFYNSKYHRAINSSSVDLTEWICYTEEEMKCDIEKQNIGGYLKSYTFFEACAKWWGNMSKSNKEVVKSIPNFDAKIFKEITGIEV